MLIARAPVRISFFGGGTDLPAYFERYGGLVVSAAIDRYIYVVLNRRPGDPLDITSSDYRAHYRHRRGESLLGEGDLALPRAVLEVFNVQSGMSVFVASQIPPGTGLGGSSAVAVALVKAVSTLKGLRLAPTDIAALAGEVEIQKLGFPIGLQDQYASAFGGLNSIAFSADGVQVHPLRLSVETLVELQRNVLLFFTGTARHSGSILGRQRSATAHGEGVVLDSLHQLKEMASVARGLLENGKLGEFGRLLNDAWEHKKRLVQGISNARIDEAYSAARALGALGGKITGAGGGGFLLLYCEPPHQGAVTAALDALEMARFDVHFDFTGAHVLMNASGELAADAA